MRKIERISIVAADRERLDRLIRDRNTPQVLRGVKKLDFKFLWTMAAYDLIKLPRLIGAAA